LLESSECGAARDTSADMRRPLHQRQSIRTQDLRGKTSSAS
jgi:hypothetical protein